VERRQKASEKQLIFQKSPRSKRRITEGSLVLQSDTSILGVSATLDIDIEIYAKAFWFTNFANPPTNTNERRNFVDYIIPLHLTSTPQSTPRMSMLAVATTLFMAWCDQRPDGALSRSFYLRAVSLMKNQLSQLQGCEGNDILAAVLLLQPYEVGHSSIMSKTSGASGRLLPDQ
jgi:hypothetical protein